MRRVEISVTRFLVEGEWRWWLSEGGRIIRGGVACVKTEAEAMAHAFNVAQDLAMKGALVPQGTHPLTTDNTLPVWAAYNTIVEKGRVTKQELQEQLGDTV